jgi:hypothetical protein
LPFDEGKSLKRLIPIFSWVNILKGSFILWMAIAIGLVLVTGTGLGASLNIEGAASPINAASGNSNNAALVISVTDLNGNAVSGLGISNFMVDATIVAPGGALVDIKRASEASRAPGFYIVEIVPTTYQGTQYTWKAGVYLFSVTVEKGKDRGQTVVPMDLCSPCPASGAGQPSEIAEVAKPELTVPSGVIGTATLAPRLPDLRVTQITADTPTFEDDGSVANLPLKVTVKNFGGPTDENFKTSVDVVVGSGQRFVRPFTVTGQRDIWYPWQSGLGSGEEVTFSGNLQIGVPGGDSLYGQSATIIALADSCSGDEFMPSYCRVEESIENNNENEITTQLSQGIALLQAVSLVKTTPVMKTSK